MPPGHNRDNARGREAWVEPSEPCAKAFFPIVSPILLKVFEPHFVREQRSVATVNNAGLLTRPVGTPLLEESGRGNENDLMGCFRGEFAYSKLISHLNGRVNTLCPRPQRCLQLPPFHLGLTDWRFWTRAGVPSAFKTVTT